MSYTFTVRTQNGVSTVTAETNVPDGEHQISGHDDADRVDLTAERRGLDGRYIVRSTHSHTKGQ